MTSQLCWVGTSSLAQLFISGNYSCLAAKFHLHRSIGFHLVQSYIPTILFVIVSWVSFWMDVEHVPGRVALGVTTLLTISSKSAGLSSESPQVSYVKVSHTYTVLIRSRGCLITAIQYLIRYIVQPGDRIIYQGGHNFINSSTSVQ